MKMNKEFEIIIKDLEKDTIVLKETTNTIMGAVNKGKGSKVFSLAKGTRTDLLGTICALDELRETTLKRTADDIIYRMLDGEFRGRL